MSYCSGCGRPLAGGAHAVCEARAQATDPPHYCTACGRKLVVQVLPTNFRAHCVRCGPVDRRGVPAAAATT
jgi:predicted RNA-binding Zn-ribbon protein involved in translation (DUF1610 family)